MNALEITDNHPAPQSMADWIGVITDCWQMSVEAILLTGRKLEEAKRDPALPHGKFLEMIQDKLPFSEKTAQKLMVIGRDRRLANASLERLLPPAWTILYEITRLDDIQFTDRINDGTINPEMSRADLSIARKQRARLSREQELGTEQLDEGVYGVVLDDFEFDFETWTDGGKAKHASNHYDTAEDAHTAEEIVARTADRFRAAARDCVHFMWVPAPHLAVGLKVMALRGFEYKTHLVWMKDRPGTGYWLRSRHELLLIGVRGKIPAPSLGTQWQSVVEGPVRAHSQKPDWQYELIEELFPTLPKIELNARQRRAGWGVWGNDLPKIVDAA